MKVILIFLLGLIAAVMGLIYGFKLMKMPLKIEFKVSYFEVFWQAFMMFYIIMISMALEMYFNQWQLGKWSSATPVLQVISRLIDAGALIAVVLPLISWIFGMWIIQLNMDLCRVYSEKVVKTYYSLAILANCVWYICLMDFNVLSESVESQNIFNRIVIWGLNIWGSWIGIGFHCKGRVYEEIENIKRSKTIVERQEVQKYCIPYIIAFIVNNFIFVVQAIGSETLKNLMGFLYIIGMLFGVFLVVPALIFKWKEYPSENKSNKILVRIIQKMKKTEVEKISGNYETVKYSVTQDKNSKYLLIHKRDVIWIGHEDEVKEVYGEKKILLEAFDYSECQKYLQDVLKRRRKFAENGFRDCREEAKQKLIAEKIEAC